MTNKLFSFAQKIFNRDFLYIFILSIVTIYIWYPLTRLTLQWESYFYIRKHSYLPLFTNTWHSFGNFDVQSMFVGAIFSNLFGLHMSLYFWAEIISILIINISVYFLTKTLTKSSATAFIASFIFSVYFFGIGFFLPNWYATFVQRVILNVPLMLGSFIFLHRFIAEKKFKFYILSLSLFFFSIFLARFGILLSFSILLYPIFWEIIQSFRLRSFLRGFLVSSPYIATVVFFLQIQKLFGENLAPKENILYFLTHPETYRYMEGIIRQLVYMSQYPSVVEALMAGLQPLSYSDPVSAYKLVFPILLAYIIGFIVIWKNGKKYRALLLTIVSSLAISLIINIYLNRFDFLSAAGANRYYYYPSFLLAIFWSLFITTIIRRKKIIIIGCILLGFFLISAALFRQHFFDLNRYGLPSKKLYEYIVSNSSQLPQGSLVVVGPAADFGPYEARFFTEQIGEKENILFRTESLGWGDWRPLASSSAHVIKLNFNEKCSCVQKEIIK